MHTYKVFVINERLFENVVTGQAKLGLEWDRKLLEPDPFTERGMPRTAVLTTQEPIDAQAKQVLESIGASVDKKLVWDGFSCFSTPPCHTYHYVEDDAQSS